MAVPRLFLDENVTPDLARALRQRGFDAVHAEDRGLKETDDAVVFAAAVQEGRAVLTQNVRDFMPIVREYAERGEHHFGLIVSPQRSLRAFLSGTLRLLSRRTAEDLHDAVVWID